MVNLKQGPGPEPRPDSVVMEGSKTLEKFTKPIIPLNLFKILLKLPKTPTFIKFTSIQFASAILKIMFNKKRQVLRQAKKSIVY